MTEDDIFRKVFSHTLAEIEIPNFAISIQKSDFEKLRKAHDSIHEFIYLAPHLVDFDEEFLAKSAFLLYHNEVFEQAHKSFLEALSGCYNAANTLLRSTLELLIKGAFWECMAHKKYRENAEVVKKTGTKIGDSNKVTLIDWLKELFTLDPSIEDELEKTSAGILDKISPLFEDETLRKIIPWVKKIIEQLAAWNVLDPIQEVFTNPVEYVYDLYGDLSADVHVEPDKTDIGRRLLAEKELFETEVTPEELDKYLGTLLKVMDIGIVIELNILEDLIIENEESKKWLRERLIDLTELDLNFSSTKIVKMINGGG